MGQGTWGMDDGSDDEVADIMRRQELEDRIKHKPIDKKAMVSRYHVAEAAKVGDMIECPNCGIKHMKSAYNKIFCSNHKTKGNRNCKDRYWNIVDESRAMRASTYCK